MALIATSGCSNAAQLEFGSLLLDHLNASLLPDLPSAGPDYVFVAGNVWSTLCTVELFKPADELVEVFSAQRLGLVSPQNVITATLAGYSHPFLPFVHPGLVDVRGPGHSGYQLMRAFAMNQEVEQQLSLEQTAFPDPVRPGGLLTYTLTVSNRGTTDLTGVVLTDVIPAGVDVVGTDGGGCCSGNQITWNVGTLFAGQSVTKQVRMTVRSGVSAPPMAR